MSPSRCFCLRQSNPFLGMTAVVNTEAARAFSVDGRTWQIQVLAQPPRGLWPNVEYADTLQYFRFGTWSEVEGLSRVPLNPVLNVGQMISATHELLGLLPDAVRELPFPPGPELELWLLDREQRPLVLLATVLEGTDLREIGVPNWCAGGHGERLFFSPSLEKQGVPQDDINGRRNHLEVLERLVRDAAGRQLNCQWFRFEAEDMARGLAYRAPEGLVGRRLARTAFPELPLRAAWPAAETQALVDDYIAWLSPYLLTLQTITDKTRSLLEKQAVRYALLVERNWRLYPKILDPDLLNQARVEARIRQANVTVSDAI